MKSVPDLIAERAGLLKRVEAINDALELLKDSTSSVEIGTRRNLRNYSLAGVTVYKDEGLTEVQAESAQEGFICKADLAHLRLERGDDENEFWWVRE